MCEQTEEGPGASRPPALYQTYERWKRLFRRDGGNETYLAVAQPNL
jgi:hypothetical protein